MIFPKKVIYNSWQSTLIYTNAFYRTRRITARLLLCGQWIQGLENQFRVSCIFIFCSLRWLVSFANSKRSETGASVLLLQFFFFVLLLFLIFLSNSHQSENISFLSTCMNCICLSINSPVCQKNAARLHEKFVVELPFTIPSSFLFVLMYSFFSLSLLYQILLSFSPLGIFLLFLTQHNKPFSLFLHSLNSQAKFNFSASRGTTLDLLELKILMCSEHVSLSYVPVFNFSMRNYFFVVIVFSFHSGKNYLLWQELN